jgi:hypothetical protein
VKLFGAGYAVGALTFPFLKRAVVAVGSTIYGMLPGGRGQAAQQASVLPHNRKAAGESN